MNKKVRATCSRISSWATTTPGRWTVVAVLLAISLGLYPLMRSAMLDQSPIYIALQGSNDSLSVNYILALYLYGVAMDRVAKRIGQRKGWILFGIGLIIILMVLKYVFGWTMRW